MYKSSICFPYWYIPRLDVNTTLPWFKDWMSHMRNGKLLFRLFTGNGSPLYIFIRMVLLTQVKTGLVVVSMFLNLNIKVCKIT